MASQRLTSDPWRLKKVAAQQRYLVSDHRSQSPFTVHPVTIRSRRRTASYALLVWATLMVVSVVALYQSLQCFRDWRDTLSSIFLHDDGGDESDGGVGVKGGKVSLEEFLAPWRDYNISYDPFPVRPPVFVDHRDRKLFEINVENERVLLGATSRELLGRIHIVPNGTVHRNYDCGWAMDPRVLAAPLPKLKRRARVRRRFRAMLPLLVPQSNSFQHFLDGVVPKLVQAAPLIASPEVTIVVLRPWDRVIEEILERFGASGDRVYHYDDGYYAADYLINTCVTPPLHPTLWRAARSRLGAPEVLQVDAEAGYVVLLTRAKSRNIGRKIRNMDKVTGLLHERYGDRLKVFQGGYSLSESTALFGRARAIVGVHGGAFYNMFMAPAGTAIVEIVPTLPNGTYIPDSVSYNIIWRMAGLLEQPYWRLAEKPVSPHGDVMVDTDKLSRALQEVDRRQGLL